MCSFSPKPCAPSPQKFPKIPNPRYLQTDCIWRWGLLNNYPEVITESLHPRVPIRREWRTWHTQRGEHVSTGKVPPESQEEQLQGAQPACDPVAYSLQADSGSGHPAWPPALILHHGNPGNPSNQCTCPPGTWHQGSVRTNFPHKLEQLPLSGYKICTKPGLSGPRRQCGLPTQNSLQAQEKREEGTNVPQEQGQARGALGQSQSRPNNASKLKFKERYGWAVPGVSSTHASQNHCNQVRKHISHQGNMKSQPRGKDQAQEYFYPPSNNTPASQRRKREPSVHSPIWVHTTGIRVGFDETLISYITIFFFTAKQQTERQCLNFQPSPLPRLHGSRKNQAIAKGDSHMFPEPQAQGLSPNQLASHSPSA